MKQPLTTSVLAKMTAAPTGNILRHDRMDPFLPWLESPRSSHDEQCMLWKII
jgi:hypothetical protein